MFNIIGDRLLLPLKPREESGHAYSRFAHCNAFVVFGKKRKNEESCEKKLSGGNKKNGTDALGINFHLRPPSPPRKYPPTIEAEIYVVCV